MNPFEYMSTLQYRVKALEQQVAEFKSGERYVKLEAGYQAEKQSLMKEIRQLKSALEASRRQTITVRNLWFEVFEDLEKEQEKELAEKDRLIRALIAENEKVAGERDAALDKCRAKQLQIYELGESLEKAEGLVQKLTSQVNRDFENSSLPSSQQGPRRKKIPNSRVKTGKKPGGQPGHPGHKRKRHPVTESYWLPAPPELTEDPDYYETGKLIRKQKVSVSLSVRVTEYVTKEYRNRKTGVRKHAPFPEGYGNEVNYDGTIKALAFLLGNECHVSHGKIRRLIRELTGGEVELSDGLVNGLCREFSGKSQPEKEEIISRLMSSPVMNADFTNANVNGKSAQVLILASPSEDVALYIGKEKKGHEGVRETPLENYVGTVVHDHDPTFYHYGLRHQECMQHNCRYLTGSEQNEPEREWNAKMHGLFREMLHYRNSLGEGEPEEETVKGFEARYDEYLELAEKEYTENPPNDYYREGYNLFLRLRKYKESELLFLHDKHVPANNSLCERLARTYKRKQKQATVLRSQENLGYICDGLSIVYLLRSKNENVYQVISDIFTRKKPYPDKRMFPPKEPVTVTG